MSLRERLRRRLPTRESLSGNRWLRPLAPWLGERRLWHFSRRGVALGVALGVFFGFLVPLAQIPMSVGGAILLRANVPMAAVSTLVTNPATVGPLYFAAYRVGAALTGRRVPEAPEDLPGDANADSGRGPVERALALGRPLFVGLLVFASIGAGLAYALVSAAWTLRVRALRRKGRHGRLRDRDVAGRGKDQARPGD
ncbi:MAG: DUF2062 domain-containing protein [Pseudoxanthomonas suwonensis]|nr:DUF2062 domain-containing protein [Pseudoxanthomonas suwonensis]